MKITINGMEITARESITILEAAKQAEIYIPTLCHVRGKNADQPCGLCVVELDGSETPVRSCDTKIREGMSVSTDSEMLRSCGVNVWLFSVKPISAIARLHAI